MKRTFLLLTNIIGCLALLNAQPAFHTRTFGIRDGLPSNNISGMQQDSKGLMWIATYGGLCCYDGYQFTTFSGGISGADSLSSNRIAKIRIVAGDNVLLRTYGGDVFLFDTHKGHYAPAGGDADALLSQNTAEQKAAEATTGPCWTIAGGSQLTITDSRGAQTAIALSRDARHYKDLQGNLWLTSPHGLTLVNFRQQKVAATPLSEGQPTRSVLCRRNGSVVAGTSDGYIAVIDRQGTVTQWLTPSGTIGSERRRFADRIYSLYEDSHGTLWIGTKGMGLYTLTASGQLSHYTSSASPEDISSNSVYDFCEDGNGNLWIATFDGGLNVLPAQAVSLLSASGGKTARQVLFINSIGGLAQYPKGKFMKVRRLTRTADGTMIASTTSGLLTFPTPQATISTGSDTDRLPFFTTSHRQGDSTSLRTDDVMQTLVCRDGRLLVTTMGGNVQQVTSDKLLRDNLTFKTVSKLSSTAGNVLSLVEDASNGIWAFREILIERWQPSTDSLLQYDCLEPGTELTEAKPAIGSDGRLWMGITGGITGFLPQEMEKSSFRPNIIFTNVHFSGEEEAHPLLYKHTVHVATPAQRYLAVSFAALDFGGNYLLRYAYRMDSDKQWIYIGHTPRIVFSQLAPGRHVLTVRSTNCDGVWTDNAATLEIVVAPLWWERRWVQLLVLIVIVVASTWAVTIWLRHRQRGRLREQRLSLLLRQYRELQESIASQQTAGQPSPEPAEAREYRLEEPQISNPDEETMDRLMKFIEQHISDENLRIEDMAEAVGMGRTAFYGKVKQIVGVSPSDFLRQMRMQRAQQLLAKSRLTVSEVAYSVGFNDPKYFTRCFKKETGMSPSQFRAKG